MRELEGLLHQTYGCDRAQHVRDHCGHVGGENEWLNHVLNSSPKHICLLQFALTGQSQSMIRIHWN